MVTRFLHLPLHRLRGGRGLTRRKAVAGRAGSDAVALLCLTPVFRPIATQTPVFQVAFVV